MRKVIVTTNNNHISAKELYAFTKESFKQWKENELIVEFPSLDFFTHYAEENTVFVAHDAETGELLAMRIVRLVPQRGYAVENNLSVLPKAKRQGIGTQLLKAEIAWLRKSGYRYTICDTGTTATWSVRWHLKNGYYITGYMRNERDKYTSYKFRKPIALDIKHHPSAFSGFLLLLPLLPKSALQPLTSSLISAKTVLVNLMLLAAWQRDLNNVCSTKEQESR